MKAQIIAIATLGACTLFAGPHHGHHGNDGVRLAADIIHLVGAAVRIVNPPTATVVTTVAPETYTYVVYNGVNVPYCNGYYFVNNAWAWRGCGPAPCPPPRIRPVPHAYRVPRPHAHRMPPPPPARRGPAPRGPAPRAHRR